MALIQTKSLLHKSKHIFCLCELQSDWMQMVSAKRSPHKKSTATKMLCGEWLLVSQYTLFPELSDLFCIWTQWLWKLCKECGHFLNVGLFKSNNNKFRNNKAVGAAFKKQRPQMVYLSYQWLGLYRIFTIIRINKFFKYCVKN